MSACPGKQHSLWHGNPDQRKERLRPSSGGPLCYDVCVTMGLTHAQESDEEFGAAVKKELTSALKDKAEGTPLALADAARDAEAFRRCARLGTAVGAQFAFGLFVA